MKRSRIIAALLALVMILATAAPAFATEYTVVKGDNLSKIAQKYLGEAKKWKEIYEANKDKIKDPNKIYIGQVLTIPDGQEEPKNVFTGSSTGMQGTITVAMTVEDGKITKVELTECHETVGVADVAVERIPAQIVAYQTTSLDAVTGATLASNGIMRAAAAAAKAAGLDASALRANAYHAQPGADETWNTEVLVIGGGGAGLSAAISAAESGAKVTLIEKAGMLGGNTFHAGGAFNAVDPEAQSTMHLSQGLKNTLDSYLELTKDSPELHFDLFPEWYPVLEELQKEIRAYYAANEGKEPYPINAADVVEGKEYLPGFDSTNLAMWHMYTGGLREKLDGSWTASDVNLARSLATNGILCYKWLKDTIGIEGMSYGAGTTCSTVLGAMWPRTHSYPGGNGIIQPLKAKAEELGVTIVTETAGKTLIKDAAGKVVGATAEKADGTKVTINTANGVILACGGYCANPAMVKQYDQYWGDDLTDTTLTTNAGTNEGDGIVMAMAIGAATRDLDISQMMPSSSAVDGTMTKGMWSSAEAQLWIGADGKRIVNEYAERDVLAKAGLAEKDGIFYIICSGFGNPATGLPSFFGSLYPEHMWYGSTLAELAEATKTPVGGATSSFTEEQLRAVIENYNEIVTNQYDPDFGKEMISGYVDLEAIESNPNVGITISPRRPSLHHTMGGVVINTNTEVLDTDGNVIPGLWAAGEVTGGVHAGNRLGGNAVADIFTHGRIAGQNAAAEKIYTAGTYTATAGGYNGDVTLAVTFSDTAITDIQIVAEGETSNVGTLAYDIMFADILAANGSGVDAVAGATFTSRAIKTALNDAAKQAGCTDLSAFRKRTVEHTPGDPVEGTWDVIIVGAGGAGMGAAAQAAQNGATVLVIEKNAQIGGNTMCSGGAFQSVMPYLCWDPDDPDATEGVYAHDGKTYTKVKSGNGAIETLKTIYNWSEEPFDADYYKDHEYEAGDIEELSKHGVHAEYLETLKELKAEIKAYLDWAQPKLDAGAAESTLTLFSTVNLHIFQTYYGGLRQSADKTEWIYGDPDLVKQFITDGQGFKEWLEDQGSLFNDADQSTLIGALWWRENSFSGGDLDGDGVMNPAKGDVPAQFGTYFAVPRKTLLETSSTAAQNKIMTRTTAKELITDADGKVIGVKAEMYDGTPVTVYANQGVILATGGYAANIELVQETNKYWNEEYITDSTKTTNRSSQVGEGIAMAQAIGADVVGMGWTQMMPISWIDNGNLAFGAGNYAVYINPTTGKRFVNESAERDVLSLGEFQNGVELMGSQGVFLEISNAETVVGFPYPYDTYVAPGVEAGATTGKTEIDNRVYFARSAAELQETLDKFGMEADAKTIYETIEAYDKAVMAGVQPPEVKKENPTKLVGTAEVDENGKYKPETYKLDGELIRIRLMAPSTHHTMGGLKVDTERHVIDTDGNVIKGLWAAGEVTGGIHGGNRLGGNAIVEIFVSGRTAANSITKEATEFTASAMGFSLVKPVTVTTTIQNGKITAIKIVDSGETAGPQASVEKLLIPRIIEKQTLALDAITGATGTSGAVRQAVLDCCLQAGLTRSDVMKRVEKTPGAAETYDVDVVIVGMGGTGVAAALSAAENGANVLAIDKAGRFGGTSAFTSGPMGINVPSQVAANDGKDLVDREALYKDWTEYTTVDGVQHAKVELIDLELDETGKALDWLSQYGFAFNRATGALGGTWPVYCGYVGGKSLTEGYFQRAVECYVEMGGKYMLETEGTELIIEDGTVVGVKAQKADGTPVTINAKSVILATGGFIGNEEMQQKYLGEVWQSYTSKQNDGKMIQAAIDAGAATKNIDMPPMSHFVAPYRILTALEHMDNDVPYVLVGSAEAMIVDKTGARQLNEADSFTFSAFNMGSRIYSVWSAEQMEILREKGLSQRVMTLYLHQGGVPANTPITNIDAIIEEAIRVGSAVKAATLDELAEKTGMDAATLKASVAAYQKAASGEAPDPLGKDAKYFERMGAPADNSEYYIAFVGAPHTYSTCGGLDVNTELQVLDTEGNVIPGLYAAGTDSMGVLFTNTKGYCNYGGVAQGWCYMTGRLAGANAAKAAK